MSSRLLSPMNPGGLLSPSSGDELTAAEELVVQAITAGSYFVFREAMGGDKNDVNTVFTLASAPNPTTSVCVFYNGQLLDASDIVSVVGANVTLAFAPTSTDKLVASYTVDPN